MGGFKRALLGYRRTDVDAAITRNGARIAELEGELPKIGKLEEMVSLRDRELGDLSTMVVERERDNRELREELHATRERHDKSIASLELLSERLEEVQSQARGQATRIRMKALREAVEVSRRVQELTGRMNVEQNGLAGNGNGNGAAIGGEEATIAVHLPAGIGVVASTGDAPRPDLFEGSVRVDIGPLGDFSQLVGFEDAVGQIRAVSAISVERFSEGRATIAMRLDEPVDLLQELDERCPMNFEVRHTAANHVVLDVDPAAASRAA